MEFDRELAMLKPKMFVDREELKKIISCAVITLREQETWHQIIAVHGMGGIGKSRLLHELNCLLGKNNHQALEIIHATMGLENDNMLHSLLSIRKKVKQTCYLFDYALAVLQDSCLIEVFNSEYQNQIKHNLVHDIISLAQDTIPIPTPGLGDVIDVINDLVQKAKYAKVKSQDQDTLQALKDLSDADPKRLQALLPTLLGRDLNSIAVNTKLVVFLDACDGGESWLCGMLRQISSGVFVLMSRERLELSNIQVTSYHMQEIPYNEAKKYLENYIAQKDQANLIPAFLEATERIPIYMELAVNAYLQCKDKAPNNLAQQLSFQTKDELTRHFLDHLPSELQEALLTLAVVGIFDRQIFEHFIDDLNLQISKLKYDDLCQISLIERNGEICELHNIFCRNASKLISGNKKYRVFQSYLSYLAKRGILQYSNELVWVYFTNILNLAVQNGFNLSVAENEEILDMFFALRDQRFECGSVHSQESNNKVLLTFISAASELHADVSTCLELLGNIRSDIDLLGKHKSSYHAIRCYSLCIKGQYQRAMRELEQISGKMMAGQIMDWYYGKIKIYLADCLMLTGKFQDAYMQIDDYMEAIEPYNKIKGNDIFEGKKLKGHCLRFNFLLDEASAAYSELYAQFGHDAVTKSYCLTCLCETKCYFEPDYVISHFQTAVEQAKKAGQERSRAKIYCSLGIAYTVKRDFAKARQYIRESATLHKKCHYSAGEFFAHLAKCYYYYAKDGSVPSELIKKAEAHASQLNVYGYLLLPLYLMKKDKSKVALLAEKYQWFHWTQTVNGYTAFFESLAL